MTGIPHLEMKFSKIAKCNIGERRREIFVSGALGAIMIRESPFSAS